jgi:hypothetical protein
MVIEVDTSGSIGSDELEQFAEETSAISDEAQGFTLSAGSSAEFEPSDSELLTRSDATIRPTFSADNISSAHPSCQG